MWKSECPFSLFLLPFSVKFECGIQSKHIQKYSTQKCHIFHMYRMTIYWFIHLFFKTFLQTYLHLFIIYYFLYYTKFHFHVDKAVFLHRGNNLMFLIKWQYKMIVSQNCARQYCSMSFESIHSKAWWSN